MSTRAKTAKPNTVAAGEVTSGAAWRKKKAEGVLVTLPSGNVARLVRTLDLPLLLKAGKIPNPLAPIVQEMLDLKKPALNLQGKDDDGVLIEQLLELVHSQLPRIFIEPKVVQRPEDADLEWEPADDEITVDDIDPEDAMFVFAYGQGGPSDAATFREESKKAVADMANEPKPALPTKRTGRAG
jgi:hypothetical protein